MTTSPSHPPPADSGGEDEPAGKKPGLFAKFKAKLGESSDRRKEVRAWIKANRLKRDKDDRDKFWIDKTHSVRVDTKDPVARENATAKIEAFRRKITIENVDDDDYDDEEDERPKRKTRKAAASSSVKKTAKKTAPTSKRTAEAPAKKVEYPYLKRIGIK